MVGAREWEPAQEKAQVREGATGAGTGATRGLTREHISIPRVPVQRGTAAVRDG